MVADCQRKFQMIWSTLYKQPIYADEFVFDIFDSCLVSRVDFLLFQLVSKSVQKVEEENADQVPCDGDGDVHCQGGPGVHGGHVAVGEEDEDDAVEDKPRPEHVEEDVDKPGETPIGAEDSYDSTNTSEVVDPNEPAPRPLDVGHQLCQGDLLDTEDDGEGEPRVGVVVVHQIKKRPRFCEVLHPWPNADEEDLQRQDIFWQEV